MQNYFLLKNTWWIDKDLRNLYIKIHQFKDWSKTIYNMQISHN